MYLKLKHLLACKENLFKNQNFKKKKIKNIKNKIKIKNKNYGIQLEKTDSKTR